MAAKYTDRYTKVFSRNYRRLKSLRSRIERTIDKILDDPERNTEPLKRKKGYDLRGLRSAEIGRNFRIIFAVCEGCRSKGFKEKNIMFCKECGELPKKTVIFLTVGPHDKAYKMR